ncbi:MAG: type II secretory pathway component PulK [bacterium]|jgi:type II secretory pathway component PulK
MKSGVALFMTLSILLVMSISITQLIENTGQEIKLIQNNQTQFQIDSYARSIFRSILTATASKGANQVALGFQQLRKLGIPLTIENGRVYGLRLESLDHRFSLNTEIQSRNKDALKQVYQNLIALHKDPMVYLDDASTLKSLSAIQDWIDKDETLFDLLLVEGDEGNALINQFPQRMIKNRKLDYLAELKTIPAVSSLYKTLKNKEAKTQLRDFFTVYEIESNSCGITGKLNLNMLQGTTRKEYYNEILLFIQRFSSLTHCDANKFVPYAKDIANAIAERVAKNNPIFKKTTYKVPIKTDQVWIEDYKSGGITATIADDFFKGRSKFIRLKFQVEIDQVKKSVQADLELDYASTSSEKLNTIKILSFQIQ